MGTWCDAINVLTDYSPPTHPTNKGGALNCSRLRYYSSWFPKISCLTRESQDPAFLSHLMYVNECGGLNILRNLSLCFFWIVAEEREEKKKEEEYVYCVVVCVRVLGGGYYCWTEWNRVHTTLFFFKLYMPLMHANLCGRFCPYYYWLISALFFSFFLFACISLLTTFVLEILLLLFINMILSGS